HPGGATCTVTVPATSCTITGLTNGTDYTFTATATNALGTSTTSPASAAITPSTVGVNIAFTNTPTQIVPGQQVLFNLDATSTPRSLQRALDTRATAGVSGTAVIKANGVTICTATITNGHGSCAGRVNGTGTITFTATFNGTIAGVSGTATATVTTKATTATVAIGTGKLVVGRCTVTLTLTGRDAKAGATITIWMQKGTKKIKLGTTRTKANKTWRFVANLNTLKTTIWAADTKSKGAKLTIKATTKNTTVRGC
ncbi:MAG: fibronectin type III domain-containing protein, partial [Actinomycetes bacterium]